jgi:hypothetical protein
MKRPFKNKALEKMHRETFNTSRNMWGGLALLLAVGVAWWTQSSMRAAIPSGYMIALEVPFATFVLVAFSRLEFRLKKLRTKIEILDGYVVFHGAPGWRFLSFAGFIFSKKTCVNLVEPIISDMREEYFEALSQNRIWKARWVRVRGTWSFFAAMGLDRFFSVVSLCVKVWKSVN